MRHATRLLGALSAPLLIASGVMGFTGTASAAPALSVTLSAHGAASAHWDVNGNPVLAVFGAGSSAHMQVNNPPSAAPGDAPRFASSGFAGDSPHWLIQFADGDALLGLAVNSGHGAANWAVVTPPAGACHVVTPPLGSYTAQLKFIQDSGCGGSVDAASIVASNAVLNATITDVLYAGMTLVPGPDMVTVASPGVQTSVIGDAITPVQIKASSVKGDAIASFAASGLPAGLSIDHVSGKISGTPLVTGAFAVTVTATDNGGTKGSVSFVWLVRNAPIVTYSGTIRLFRMGLCLDDQMNSSSNGAVVQVWRCNGLPNQNWQVMSDGTIRHNGLCLDARNFGTANRTPIQLWACTGGPNQKWDTRGFRVHYDNPMAFNKVLDDPAFGGNGTRQELFTNNGGVNQQWATF